MPVTVDVEIDEFDDDEVLDEALRRGLIDPKREEDLLKLMKDLGVPPEVQQPVKDWLFTPVADEAKLQEWIKIS